MEPTWLWLNNNNGALVALATLVGALVAAVYAFMTGGLWRQAREQAKISRAMLEASQRPYLRVEPVLVGPELSTTQMIEFHFHNHGSVPAVATWWKFALLDGDAALFEQETEKPATLCVFPAQAMDPKPFILGPLLGPLAQKFAERPLRLQATVKYRGLPNTRYETRVPGVIVAREDGTVSCWRSNRSPEIGVATSRRQRGRSSESGSR